MWEIFADILWTSKFFYENFSQFLHIDFTFRPVIIKQEIFHAI